MRRTVLLAALAAALVPAPALAETGSLTASGSVRVRGESLTGQFRPGFAPDAAIVSIKTILTAEYRTGPLRFGGELIDSRVYGADSGTPLGTNDVDAAEPVQAWVAADLREPLGKGSKGALQLGRMTVNLGSRRLIANDEFRNTANGFTGARLDLSKGADSATLLALLPQRRLPDDLPALQHNAWQLDRESFGLRLWGGMVAHSLGAPGTVQLTFLRLDERDGGTVATRDRRLNSFGVHLVRDPRAGVVDYDLELIGQTGSIAASTAPAAPRVPVRAGFAHAEAGYLFPGRWKLHVALEYDWASGDAPGGRYGRFDTLYGMRGADFAPTGLYAAIARANLSTPGIRVEAAPGKRIDGFVSGKLLWADQPADVFATTGVRDPTGRSGRYAGEQLEGRLRYWLLPSRLRADANAVLLLRRGLLRDAPGLPTRGDTLFTAFALVAMF